VTLVNISLGLLLTYFTCHHGDDVSSDDVTGRGDDGSLPWQQPVMAFVDKLLHSNRRETRLHSNRRETRYLDQTFSLVSRLFTLHIPAGTLSQYPSFLIIFVQLEVFLEQPGPSLDMFLKHTFKFGFSKELQHISSQYSV